MMWKKIIGVLSLTLITIILSRSLLTSPARTIGDLPQLRSFLVQQPALRASAELNDPTPATCAATPVPPAIGSQETDGKELIPPDGKTVLPPDGKEALPPVGELVGQRSQSVDPGHAGPPTEFLNKQAASPSPLLTPPNPFNVSGPVVSAETRSPP